ncbi:MAG: hypothetical protein GW839_08195 [Flavobacteriales bacterium]|nr:hypothetical protein [Flavobacteriia bacterium]NCP06519.1 hypothetical protein [Flavobacteriales bacterium]PIV93871.1 MAG: hypothetical protein COW44_07335 [Flavobacteriaceae bacterium CG17_big_fil_post_rev_8_21_14_2_50_33_15]PIY09362.1 MAG: hypothetical protein COZ17_13215 [Flavobacteriaceae bacterium CG_4_10_14_3_um_filter_33_47]PJB17670.1 MAG: hypothetical protein CO117_10880 [Flavobacteriaceae bacterium CG_4_9_14_3_um_filter_33_16]
MKNKVINLFGNNKVVQNEGVKYSELLEQFINPFMNEFEDYEYAEDIFEFAISAWNFGNIKAFLPKEEFEESTQLIQTEVDGVLLNKMIDYKVANFKAYENFIVDYELKEVNAGEDPILSVITQEKETYLHNMMDAFDNEVSENDFEENYINRYAIVIKPQQPFFDWINKLYPNDKISEVEESNIYLVNDEIDDLEKWLQKKFDKFFMMELDEWHTNKKEWPQKRNYKMFKQWFHVDISTMIYDLEKRRVLK